MTSHRETYASRNAVLECVRVVAALIVVLGHLRMHGFLGDATASLPWYLQWIALGHLSVLVFFALSGFVLTLNRVPSDFTSRWLRKRLRRLGPLYLVALLVPVAGDAVMQRGLRSVHELLNSLLLLPALSPRFSSDPRNPPLWSLQVELLLSLVLWLWARRRGGSLASGAVRMVWVTMLLAVACSALQVPLLEGLPAFFFGSWLAAGQVRPSRRVQRASFAMSLATLALFSGWYAESQGSRLSVVVGLAWVGLLLVAVTGTDLNETATRVSVWLGQRTYAIYAVHWPVILAVNTVLPTSTLGRTVATAAAIALVTELAFRFVDRPAVEWSRRA